MESGRDCVEEIARPTRSTIGSKVPIQPTIFRKNMYETMSWFPSALR